MKKILLTILALLFIPQITFGAFASGWNATSSSQSWISPTAINGILPTIAVKNIIATSTTDENVLWGKLTVVNYLNFTDDAQQNTCGGHNCLLNITTGIDNTCFGIYCLINTTEGSFNFSMGAGALGNNTTGSDNIAIGLNALAGVVGGGQNLGIGTFACGLTGLVSRNICFGYYSGAYAVSSDEFYVGNRDFSNNATEKTNSLFYGIMAATPANQSLRINASTTISQSLQVQGSASSTFSNGINLMAGCFAFNGICLSATANVVGPSSATDEAIARYDGTTGKLLQDSIVTVDDSGQVSSGNILPRTDNTYSLGSPSKQWGGMYLPSGSAIVWNNKSLLTNSGTVGIKVGEGAADAVVSSTGFFDLILKTGNSTTGNITIADGANADILISPNGTGKVGIGTTSPYRSLSVADGAVFGNDVIASNFTGTSTTASTTFAGGFAIKDSALVVDQTTGRIGIGTTSPNASKLHIVESVFNINSLRVDDQLGDPSPFVINHLGNLLIGTSSNTILGTAGKVSILSAGTSNGSTAFQIHNANTIPIFKVFDGGLASSTSLVVDTTAVLPYASSTSLTVSGEFIAAAPYGIHTLANGNTSIGDIAPTHPLDIDTCCGTALTMTNNDSTSYVEAYWKNDVIQAGLYLNGSTRAIDGGGSMFNFYNDGGGTQYRTAGDYVWLNGAYPGVEKGRFLSNGRFGIGTTSPFATLSIHANTANTYAPILFAVASSTPTATTTHFAVTSGGSVGIGTTTGAGKVTIQGTGGENLLRVIDPSIADGSGMNFAYKTDPLNGGFAALYMYPDLSNHQIYFGDFTGSHQLYRGVFNATNGLHLIVGSASADGGYILGQNGAEWHWYAPDSTHSVIGSSNSAERFWTGNFAPSGTDPANLFSLPTGTSGIGLASRAVSSQTGDLQQWQNSSSKALALVNVNGWLGVGTSSPYAKISIHANTADTYSSNLFVIASSTPTATTTLFTVNSDGHIITGGGIPACDANCTMIAGNDNAFRVITGIAKTTMTVTFKSTWGEPSPICVASEGSGGSVTVNASSTPTTVVLTALSALSSVDIEVQCTGIR